MLLNEHHYDLIDELEREYGSLVNVPEKNHKLKEIRKYALKNGKAKIVQKCPTNWKAHFDYHFCYEIYKTRASGFSIEEVANEYDLPFTTTYSILKGLGVRKHKKITAILEKEGKKFESDSMEMVLGKLHKYKQFRNLTRPRANQISHDGKLYKDTLRIITEDIFPIFTLEQIKRKTFERRLKQKNLKNIDKAIEYLNKINGEGAYTLEEVNRWNNR